MVYLNLKSNRLLDTCAAGHQVLWTKVLGPLGVPVVNQVAVLCLLHLSPSWMVHDRVYYSPHVVALPKFVMIIIPPSNGMAFMEGDRVFLLLLHSGTTHSPRKALSVPV